MLTQEELKRILHYNLDTGIFTRLKASGNARVGDVAGGKQQVVNHKGTKRVGNYYIIIKVKGIPYYAHRLAFLYVLGYMPKEVDHDNRIPYDNAWANLFDRTTSENQLNCRVQERSNTGITGVAYRGSGVWRTYFKGQFKRYFSDFFEACCYRKSIEAKHHGL